MKKRKLFQYTVSQPKLHYSETAGVFTRESCISQNSYETQSILSIDWNKELETK